MSGEPMAAPDDDRLGPVVESFLDRFRRGERPALTDLAARYPELAGQIRELIPALVELEQLGGGEAMPSSPGIPAGARGRGAGASPPDRLGDYVILRLIGGGGMGVVYEAEHESLKSRVALKVMHPRFRADAKYLHRFHAEARLAAGLHHTNIVGVFDYGEQDGVCYYAMQFIDGQPLDLVLADIHRLRDEGARPGPGTIGGASIVAESAPVSVAVRGLFTGRFEAPAGTADAGDSPDEGPDATATTGAIVAAGDGPDWRDPDTTEALPREGMPAPAEPSTGDGAAAISSTSLGGSGEQRYFREIARVGAQVADALEFAHKRGVLHRDIKPSNLLLDALGNVWVTDFGLAKLEEADGLTQSHELVGTLRYMAPERLRGKSGRGGDVYSLGATLYELLTLRPPFSDSDQIRLIERIREGAPVPPRQLDRSLPRDLETMVLKALAKDPKDRFASAGEMAEELRRFVEGRPIRSRPVSVPEQFWRWCKRERRLAAACIAAAMLTIFLAFGSTVAALVFRDQVARIRVAETATKKHLFDSLVSQAQGTRLSRRPGQRFDGLKALRAAAGIARELKLPPSDVDRLRDEAIACLALPDLEPDGPTFTRPPGGGGIINWAFDPSMTRIAWRFRDGTISVRRAADGREIARFRAEGDRDTWILEFSPDGRYLAADDYPSHAMRVWDIERGALIVVNPAPSWWQAAFRPDSRRILVGNGPLREYELPTGRLVRTWPVQLVKAAYRLDGARIAAVDDATRPPTCRIFEAESGRPVRSFPLRAGVDALAWSADGRTLATASGDMKIDTWDVETGIRRATLEGHNNGGFTLSFHPAGTLLASNGWETRLRLWDPILGLALPTKTGGGCRFGRDGRLVLGLEDELTTYRVEPALEYRTYAHAAREPWGYGGSAIRQDGRILAVGADRGLVLWDLADGAELGCLPIGRVWAPIFEPSGDMLTYGEGGVQRWPIRLDAGRGELRVGPPRRLPLPVSTCGMALDPSGRILAAAANSHAYVATPGRTFRVGPLDDCRGVAISPDGRWLATGSHVRGAQVWRIDEATADPAKVATKVADLAIDYPNWPRFSPDGKWLVSGNPQLRLWEVGTWRPTKTASGLGVIFSPDGRLMIDVEPSRILRLVDFATGRTLARLEGHDLSSVPALAFSPDGSRLVVPTNDRPSPSVHVWDLRRVRKELARMSLDWDAPAYPEVDPAAPAAPLSVVVEPGPFRGLSDENRPPLLRARQLVPAGKIGEAVNALRGLAVRFPDLAEAHNDLAWLLATGPGPRRRPAEAVEHARRAVGLAPEEAMYLNTYGVALCRAARFAEAVPILEESLAAGHGQFDAFDLFFLAMARHRLGHRAAAREDFDRAVRWVGEQTAVEEGYARELKAFRAEAEAVLAGPAGELPDDVFAPRP